MNAPDHPGNAQFTTTHWSVVLAAGQADSPDAQPALEQLCRTYWYPLYAYLRRDGRSPEDAQDAVQSFLAHLLQNHRLARAHPDRGRFRSFLLVSLRHFLADEHRRQAAQKRGGGLEFIPLEGAAAEARYGVEPVEWRDPEKLYERRWALAVLEQVLERLKMEATAAGAMDRFARLQPYLLADGSGSSYAEVGRELGMTEGAVKMAVLRLRQRGRELFRAEIAHTVASEADIEEEVRHLFTVLGQ